MMGQQTRSEALFYYFRMEDQVPETVADRKASDGNDIYWSAASQSASSCGVMPKKPGATFVVAGATITPTASTV